MSTELDAAFSRFQEVRNMDILELAFKSKVPLCALDFVALLENMTSRYSLGRLDEKYKLLFFEKIQIPLARECFLDHVSGIANEASNTFSNIVAQRVSDAVKRVELFAACLSALGHVEAFLKDSSQSEVSLAVFIL